MTPINSVENLKFSIGSCFYPKFIFAIEGNVLNYGLCTLIHDLESDHQTEVSNAEVENFIFELNNLNLVCWKNEYSNDLVLDGEDWELEISYNKNKKKHISGSNHYPGTRFNSTNRSPKFNRLMNAFRVLIRDPDFFKDKYQRKSKN